MPEGQVVTRIWNESGDFIDHLTIQNWNQKPWYPTGESRREVMNRVSKNLRDGNPVVAYRELKELEASAANLEEEAEWYRLNASVLDVFARIDRVQSPRSKRDLKRALELAPEDSPVQTRALIDRAKRAREESFRRTSTSPSHDHQIAKILEKLTDRLDRPGQARGYNAPSSLKMPALQLPTIRRSANNDVTARSYFQWKISLSTVISLHGVSPDAILIHYATTPKLLPEEFTTIMANSESLQEAIGSLDTLFPSLASIRPELIRGMTDLPPLVNATEKTRVFRITTLLRLLDEFLKFFGASPHRDLTRQDVLVILHNFFGLNDLTDRK